MRWVNGAVTPHLAITTRFDPGNGDGDGSDTGGEGDGSGDNSNDVDEPESEKVPESEAPSGDGGAQGDAEGDKTLPRTGGSPLPLIAMAICVILLGGFALMARDMRQRN